MTSECPPLASLSDPCSLCPVLVYSDLSGRGSVSKTYLCVCVGADYFVQARLAAENVTVCLLYSFLIVS